MKTGVYAKKDLEIVITKHFKFIYYKNVEDYGVKVFKDNLLIARVSRKLLDRVSSSYFFINSNNEIKTNTIDFNLDEKFDESLLDGLVLKDEINVSKINITLPKVSEAGIEKCLKLWRMGVSLDVSENIFNLQMRTSNLEYGIYIDTTHGNNIYCCISINIPFENGLFGSSQYFRIRDYKDNLDSYCHWCCDLSETIVLKEFNKLKKPEDGCTFTNEGSYWFVKRYNDEEIVLDGCGGDEYIYKRNTFKIEYFN